MELYVLGSGSCVPYSRRGPAGLALVINEDNQLLLDGGSGTIRQLVNAGLDFRKIDYLLYSHTHPDHTTDFITFLFASNCTPEFTRKKELHVVGPTGFSEFYKRLTEIYPILEPKTYKLDLAEVWESSLVFLDWELKSLPMFHGNMLAVGYRIEYKGKSVVYSGDTGYCENIVKLAKDADLVILDCSFPDEFSVPQHLSPSTAGRIAEEAKAKKLLLTHLYPICDSIPIFEQAKKYYSGEVIIAEDLMKLTI